MDKLTDFCEDKRHFKPHNNAARERSRVKTLRSAFLDLQRSLPAVPPNTKLSKLDVLVLATAYICHLTRTLDDLDHNDVYCQIGAGQNIRSLSNNEDEGDGMIVRLTDAYVQQPLCSLVSASSFTSSNSALKGRVVKDKPVKSYRQVHPYDKHSQPVYSASYTGSTKQKYLSQSKGLSRPMISNLDRGAVGILHPVKKWPMRTRLYDGILGCTTKSEILLSSSSSTSLKCLVQSSFISNNHASFKQGNLKP